MWPVLVPGGAAESLLSCLFPDWRRRSALSFGQLAVRHAEPHQRLFGGCCWLLGSLCGSASLCGSTSWDISLPLSSCFRRVPCFETRVLLRSCKENTKRSQTNEQLSFISIKSEKQKNAVKGKLKRLPEAVWSEQMKNCACRRVRQKLCRGWWSFCIKRCSESNMKDEMIKQEVYVVSHPEDKQIICKFRSEQEWRRTWKSSRLFLSHRKERPQNDRPLPVCLTDTPSPLFMSADDQPGGTWRAEQQSHR